MGISLTWHFFMLLIGARALASLFERGTEASGYSAASDVIDLFCMLLKLAVFGYACVSIHTLVNYYIPHAGLHSAWFIVGIAGLVYWRVWSNEAHERWIDETSGEMMHSVLEHPLVAPHLKEASKDQVSSAIRDLVRGYHGGYILQPPHSMGLRLKDIAESVMWQILKHNEVDPYLSKLTKQDLTKAILETKARYLAA